MPKLLYSSASPYSAKVRMCAAHAGFLLHSEAIDTSAPPAELSAVNPLGKIPVLLTEENGALYDSRVITQYIDRASGGALFPRKPGKRTQAERLEALADGICDCLLAHVYERRSRPATLVHQPWLDKQWTKVLGALDSLESAPPKAPRKLHAGHIALRSTLGYLTLRFAGEWEEGRGGLRRWANRFDKKHPDLASFLPS